MKRRTGSFLRDSITVCITTLFVCGAAFTGSLLMPREPKVWKARKTVAPAVVDDVAGQFFVA